MEPQPLIDFINLGLMLATLQWPVNLKTLEDLRNRVRVFLAILETVGFTQERQEFLSLMTEMSTAFASDSDFSWQVAPNGSGEFFQRFIDLIRRTYDRMNHELASRRVLLLDQGVVTERLRELQSRRHARH